MTAYALGEREGGHSQSHTANLADAVRGYPMGIGLVKEFLQNADDAGASELRVIFDRRQHGGPVAAGLDDDSLDVVLEPALLFINDARFSDDDIAGIRRIGESSKFRRASGTGRFGKGFCTAFSVSDHPTLVTGDDVMWFDPHRRALCSNDHSTKHMRRFELSAAAKEWPAWIRTFGIAGVDPAGAPFPGTAFRLPLRDEATAGDSEISRQCFTDEVWEGIVHSARQLGPALLVFLRSVESLKLSEVDKQGKESIKLEIVTENARQVREARQPLHQSTDGETVPLLEQWLADPTDLPTAIYEHEFLITDGGGDVHHENWTVITGLLPGPDNCLLEHAHEICTAEDPDKVLPWAGAALCLETTRDNARLGGRSCFLPIGDQGHPPPVWIHGWFDLDASRSHLTKDFGSKGNASRRALWNRRLLEHGVGHYWAMLIEHLGLRLHEQPGKGYRCWAKLAVDDSDLESALSTGFYHSATGLDVMRTRRLAGPEMHHPDETIRWMPRGTAAALLDGLLEDGWRVFDPRPPKHIRLGLNRAGFRLEALSIDNLREHFFAELGDDNGPWEPTAAPSALLRERERLDAVWGFFCTAEGDLTETPLCLTNDGRLRCFDEEDLVYTCTEEQEEILATLPHRRLHPCCQEALGLADRETDLGVSPINIPDLPEFASELAERDGDITDDWAAEVLDDLVRRSPEDLSTEFETLHKLYLLPTAVGSRTPLGYRQTAGLVNGPSSAVPEDLLERLGVPILRGSPRLLASAGRALEHHPPMVNAVSPSFVAKVLADGRPFWVDPPTRAERLSALEPGDVEILLDYLAPIRWQDSESNSEVKRALRERLPLLTTQCEITRATAKDLYRPVGVFPPPELKAKVTLLDVSGDGWDSLAAALGVQALDDARLLMEQALPFLVGEADEDSKQKVRAWVLREAPRAVEDADDKREEKLRKALRRAPLLPLRTGEVGAAVDSYRVDTDESSERLTRVLGPHPRVVVSDPPLGLKPSQWRHALGILSVSSTPRASDILLSIIEAAGDWSQADRREAATERLRRAFGYLNEQGQLEQLDRDPMSRDAVKQSQDAISRSLDGTIKWFALVGPPQAWNTKPPNLSTVLQQLPWIPSQPRLWSSDPDDFTTRLYKPSELYRPGQRRLVSAVRPVFPFAEPLIEVRELLGFASVGAAEIDEKEDPGPVGEQLSALLRVDPGTLEEHLVLEFQQTVGVVYAELARLDDPESSFENWTWPHLEDPEGLGEICVLMDKGWRRPETLFFNALPIEPNPWIGSISGWSKQDVARQRPLLEAVGVRDQPEVDDWVRLLRELHDKAGGTPLTDSDLALARRALITLASMLREGDAESSSPTYVLSDNDSLIEADGSFEIDSPRVQGLRDKLQLPVIKREEDNRRVALWAGAQPISEVVRLGNPRGSVVEDYPETDLVKTLLNLTRQHAKIWTRLVARLRYHYTMRASDEQDVNLATIREWQEEALVLASRLALTVYKALVVDLNFEGTDHEALPLDERYFIDHDAAMIHIVEGELDFSLDEALARLALGSSISGPEAAEAGRILMRVARSPADARAILDRQNVLSPPDETEAVADVEGEVIEQDFPTWDGESAGETPDDETADGEAPGHEEVDDQVQDVPHAGQEDEHDFEEDAVAAGLDDDHQPDSVDGDTPSSSHDEGGSGPAAPLEDEDGPGTGHSPEGRSAASRSEHDTESTNGQDSGEGKSTNTGSGGRASSNGGGPSGGSRNANANRHDSGTNWGAPGRARRGTRKQGQPGQPKGSRWKKPGPSTTRSTSDSTRSRTTSNRTSRPRDRMTSYVAREDAKENTRHRARHEWEKKADTGKLGEAAVVAHERAKGWFACPMDTNNPGYDIASSPTGIDGLPDMDHPDARYIEVKSTKHGWDAYGVAISETQFEMAREKGASWWLYVVEHVDSERQVIHEVPNPLIDSGLQYRFDGGWAEWAARKRESRVTPPTADEPGRDPRVGSRFRQRQRNGQVLTFRVEKIWHDRSSGRSLAQIVLDSGQKKTIHNFNNWEPID